MKNKARRDPWDCELLEAFCDKPVKKEENL